MKIAGSLDTLPAGRRKEVKYSVLNDHIRRVDTRGLTKGAFKQTKIVLPRATHRDQ